MKHIILTLAALVLPFPVLADVLEIQSVADDVWAIVGPTEQRNPENITNNAPAPRVT